MRTDFFQKLSHILQLWQCRSLAFDKILLMKRIKSPLGHDADVPAKSIPASGEDGEANCLLHMWA